MTIVITLSPEVETLLLDRAARQGQEINLVASELLAGVLNSGKNKIQKKRLRASNKG
jgi:hypothetical protein